MNMKRRGSWVNHNKKKGPWQEQHFHEMQCKFSWCFIVDAGRTGVCRPSPAMHGSEFMGSEEPNKVWWTTWAITCG